MPVIVTPIDGWGFSETIDGELAPPFEVAITEVGVFVAPDIRSWFGRVVGSSAKYAGMTVRMTPRNTPWNGIVVLSVESGDGYAFSGMAATAGLDCNWLPQGKHVDPAHARD